MGHAIRCVFLLACMLAIPANLQADDIQASRAEFDRLAERFLDRYSLRYPVAATGHGDHRNDLALDKISAKAWQQRANEAEELLGALADLDPADLDLSRRIDAEMLSNELAYEIWRIRELKEWQWNPLTYTELAGQSIYGLLSRDFAPLSERLESAATRIEALPGFLADVRAVLVPARVPAIHASTAARQHKGLLKLIDDLLIPNLAAADAPLRNRINAAIVALRLAAQEHQHWIDDTLRPAATGQFRLGLATYEKKLQFTLDTKLTRATVRARAEQEYQRVRNRMYALANTVYAQRYPQTFFPDDPGDAYKQAIIRHALELAYDDRPKRDEVIAVARQSLAQVTAFVREHDLVTVPDEPLEIIEMPEFRQGIALAYCDAPGVLDKNLKTFYAVSPIPVNWSAEQTQSFLREYNTRSIHELTMHEAVPGHYLQLAHANRYPSTLRAVLRSGTFIEGWAVYSEKFMIDAGYYDGDPLMELVQLKWYLRAIINAILDQAVHIDGISEESAMQLMIEGGFQEESEAAGKWVRAQLTSTQLSSYFVGYQEHMDLRRDAEAQAGENFDMKTYHDELLSFGSPPLHLARDLVLSP